MHTREEKIEAFGRLLDVIDELRVKCPWDRKQTNASLRENTIEEAFELSDALLRDDARGICEELGDVLMHVVFYARMGTEQERFDVADVCHKECDKLIARHPHVYGDTVAETSADVLRNWEQLKLRERGHEGTLSGVPAALPALIKAYRVQDKARNAGFDWEDRRDVWQKVKEEIAEFEAEIEHKDKERATDELGDVLFSLINAARLYHLHPDTALERTNRKFIRRFNYVERQARASGRALQDMTLADMDALWDEAKREERAGRLTD